MSFNRVLGQNRPKEIILKAINNNRIPHAYLFSGPDGVGKDAFAIELAKTFFCEDEVNKPCGECSGCRRVGGFSHPDFRFIFPMPTSASVDEERSVLDSVAQDPYLRKKPWAAPSISIERIRQLRRLSALKPLEGKRVIIIAEADRMTIEATNSLLKILEEPPPFMHMILTTSKVNSILPTIISRCQEVRFGLVSDSLIERQLVEQKNISEVEAQLVARICQGSYRRAIEWLEEDLNLRREFVVELLRVCLKDNLTQIQLVEEMVQKFDKRIIQDILSLVLIWFRDTLILLNEQGNTGAIDRLLVNVDKRETLMKFVSAFQSIDYDDIFYEIEQSIESINRNVQINLILLVLLSKMRSMMKIKR